MPVQANTRPSVGQRWNDYHPAKSTLVWACVVTAIATMVIGFSWGGWVTAGTSRTLASTAGSTARGELAALICVERFNAAPDSTARLVEFKALDGSYKQRQFVEAGGWATMPGDASANRRAAEGCAAALAA
ncbi:hypothetical protein [Stappia sp.]|jgi:hypothetical protein|uniref:hypothetical protein n=1 Tax=Stappia sp. TaxID=1870903 RepID=UPI003A99D5A0